MRLVPALVCLLAVTAGCTAPAAPSTETAPTPSSTENGTSPETTGTCTPYRATPQLDAELADGVTGTFRVTLLDGDLDPVREVSEESFTGARQVTYDGGRGVFEPASSYRVRIAVDGRTRWNGTLTPTERYDIRVEENGSVTVASIRAIDTPAVCTE